MTLKKYLWEKAKKGSFTIEAACVMSLILVAVMGILYLCFFVLILLLPLRLFLPLGVHVFQYRLSLLILEIVL